MADQTIKCPYCKGEIPLTEALTSQISEGLRAEYDERDRRKDEEHKGKLSELEAAGARKLVLEKARLEEEARKRALQQVEGELKDLKEDRASKEAQLESQRKQELDLRRRLRELDEEKKAVEVQAARKLDAERERIRQGALEMFSEEHRLKDLEKEKLINDLRKDLMETKRRLDQGSMQMQGEVLELDLEALLKSKFPVDVIEPVPKGMRGADIVQKVYTRAGQCCGSIVWESKRTKAWNDEWVSKLKDDQREMKAEVAVLVSEALPKHISNFAQVDGLWVTTINLAGCLAEALRASLIQLAFSRLSAVGKNEKMEAIYNYLSGPEFRQRIEGIVESFRALKEDLEAEKRAMMKIWARREKQIERVMNNTTGMYGDMQGIIGSTLPEITTLELGHGLEEE